jgi:tetratricopeptide (TPR) repeat protein
LQLKDYQKAIIDLNKAIELKSDYADAYYNRGLYYRELKETKLAIADLQKASLLYKEQDNPEGEQKAHQILQELSS